MSSISFRVFCQSKVNFLYRQQRLYSLYKTPNTCCSCQYNKFPLLISILVQTLCHLRINLQVIFPEIHRTSYLA